MGKKSKRQSASAVAQKPQAGAVINNRAVCRAVNDLWERTQGSASDSIQALWQDYDTISSLVKVIKEKQGATVVPLADRRESLEKFEKWLKENGAMYDYMVEIAEYPDSGLGLKAKRDIKSEEKVLAIPDKLMMNSLTARDGYLGKVIAQDRILQMMHNVALALHLLNERYAGEESFWKPYIDVLPPTFTTPAFFTKAELLQLQGSPALVKSLQQIRNVAKLFSHLHRLIRTYADPALPLYKVGFYYQDFVWAVSCVMSRQNEIPLGITPETTLALIPLWDLANHTEGHMTTFFDVEHRLCECFAHQNTAAGSEFKIFYGARNNSDLFVHQGFVYDNNQSDYLPIKLGLSSAESSKTRALKERLMAVADIALPGTFKLMATGDPFGSELRFVIRVFTASHEELQSYFNEKGEVKDVTNLLAPWHPTDVKTLDFLEKRCQLLLRAYKTSIDEDRSLLGGANQLTPFSILAVRMRLSEKKILYNAALFARTLRDRLLSDPPPPPPLLSQEQNGGTTTTAASTTEATSSPPASDTIGTAATSETGAVVGPPEIVELDDEEEGGIKSDEVVLNSQEGGSEMVAGMNGGVGGSEVDEEGEGGVEEGGREGAEKVTAEAGGGEEKEEGGIEKSGEVAVVGGEEREEEGGEREGKVVATEAEGGDRQEAAKTETALEQDKSTNGTE